jgi:hypothetical protein
MNELRLPIMSVDHDQEHCLIVGTWPGSSFTNNNFAKIFAEALKEEGCTVVDVTDPARVAGSLDILHIHWPELVFWKSGRVRKALYAFRAFRAIRRMQRQGTRVVWMVHNLRPHDLSGLRRILWPHIEGFMLRHSDGFMTLAPATIEIVRRAFRELAEKPAAAALHPVYPRIADLPDREACRSAFSLPQSTTIFALLGFLRPYKGAETLITGFLQDRCPSNRLLIAGRPATPEYGEQIKALAANDPRIILRLNFLDEREFAMCLEAVDFVVLPYHSSLHSGALVHALSYGRVVITPASAFANDVAAAVGEGWVIRYSGDLPSAVFERRSVPTGSPDAAALEPRQLGRTAVDFYRKLIPIER